MPSLIATSLRWRMHSARTNFQRPNSMGLIRTSCKNVKPNYNPFWALRYQGNTRNSSHHRLCQQKRAVHVLNSDQNTCHLLKLLPWYQLTAFPEIIPKQRDEMNTEVFIQSETIHCSRCSQGENTAWKWLHFIFSKWFIMVSTNLLHCGQFSWALLVKHFKWSDERCKNQQWTKSSFLGQTEELRVLD